MKKLIIISLLILFGCMAGGEVYYNQPALMVDNLNERAHYLGGSAEREIFVAVQIKNLQALGMGYNFLLINNGIEPLHLYLEGDKLYIHIDGNKYLLQRHRPIIVDYPNSLKSESFIYGVFLLPEQFEDRINEVEYLVYEHNDGSEYILIKNEKATWEEQAENETK